jgi:phospholipase A1
MRWALSAARVSWLIAAALPAVSIAVPDADPVVDPALAAPEAAYQVVQEGPGLTLHDEMFILPYTHADRYHGKQAEVVFQLSAKQAVAGSRLYFGYTQVSYWQAYNVEESAPFRDTDYNPELFYRTPRRAWRGGQVGADLGFEHESNGQRDLLSRSWNQFYAAPHYQNGGLLARLKLRWRVPEEAKAEPGAAKGDDNPDINDYLGHADLHLYYRWDSGHQVHLLARGNPATGRGFVSLNLSRPLPHEQAAWLVVTVSHGYGESLLDYDRLVSRAGIGFMLAR